MKDENTTFDNGSMNNEETQLDDRQGRTETQQGSDNKANGGRAKWVHIAGSAGSGLLLGAASTMLMGAASANDEVAQEESANEEAGTPGATDTITVENVSFATDITDDMSFSEAFAEARHELGPGGAFEWHGNVYSTYYAEEWNGMTEAQQAEHSSHIMHAHSTYHAGHHDTAEVVAVDDSQAHTATHDTPHTTTAPDDGGDMSATAGISGDIAQNDTPNTDAAQQADDIAQPDIAAQNDGIEVEVIGITHDDATGANVVSMTVDGHDAILVDVDNNNTMDALIVDANDDGIVAENEIVDVSDQGLTIDQFGGIDNPAGDLYADNTDLPDYTNDANIDNYYA